MSKTNKKKNPSQNPVKQKVKVLYQNLGGVWYAFADVNDSIFVGKVNVTRQKAKAPASKTRKIEKEAA